MHPQCVCVVDEKGMNDRPAEVAAHNGFLLVTSKTQAHVHVPSQGVDPTNKADQLLQLKLEIIRLAQV